ncbi:hypothetical protein RI367_001877 [Sorochytrium milnesiophthora]
MASNALPRDILRWLNSLDLTFSLKNHRRSFSNGYLVAEILARYFPHDVSLHGFDTTTGKRSRNNNWSVLERVFVKKGIKVERDVVQKTIDEVPGAIEIILHVIYQHVSNGGTVPYANQEHRHDGTSSRADDSHHAKAPTAQKDKILSTAAAAALLSLEDIPADSMKMSELLVQTIGFRAWEDVESAPSLFHPEHVLRKLNARAIEFNIAAKTEMGGNLTELLSLLWSGLRYSQRSHPYQVACVITRFLLPICQETQPRTPDFVYASLQVLTPLDQLPELEQKLPDIALIIGSTMRGQESDMLRPFKGQEQLPSELYIYLLASIQQYHRPEFWVGEYNRYLSMLENTLHEGDAGSRSNAPIFAPDQLDRVLSALLAYCASLLAKPWRAEPELAQRLFVLLQGKALSDLQVYFMCLAACRVLEERPPGDSSKKWYPLLDQVRTCTNSTLLLGVAHEMLPLLSTHHCLGNLFITVLAKIRNFELLSAPHVEQPGPYAPMCAFKPLLQRLKDPRHPSLPSVVGMGLASWLQQGHRLESMKLLLPHLLSNNPKANACVLVSVHEQVLEDVLEHDTWEVVKTWLASSDMRAARQVVPAVIVTMAFHMTHSPSHPVSVQMRQDLTSFSSISSGLFRDVADAWRRLTVEGALRVAATTMASALHVETPLTPFPVTGARAKVLLKQDNLQPSGSFKIRGIGHLCTESLRAGATEFVCSSGGNAGMAAAEAGRQLQVPVTIFVPDTTPPFMRDKIAALGARVVVAGVVWNEADAAARLYLLEHPTAAYIPPFDHPSIWTGHASLVHELKRALPRKPKAIVCSVGGGGLLCGICQGLLEVGWGDVAVVAVETEGADCLHRSITEGQLVMLPGITSIAKTLGALQCCPQALEYSKRFQIESIVVSDRQAVTACRSYRDETGDLVEPSCGATLATLYFPQVSRVMQQATQDDIVVAIVCGGTVVNEQLMQVWDALP